MKKIADKMLVFICIGFVAIFGVWIFVKPQVDFSEEENRLLKGFPCVSAQGIINGEFFKGIGDFYADQFPLRRNFTDLKAKSEFALGRTQNNGVILGEEGYLLIDPKYDDLTLYLENLEAIKAFCDKYEGLGVDTEVFFAPRGVDVLSAYLPRAYHKSEREEVWEIASDKLPELLFANDEIEALAESREYVWYKTDHHWTQVGAYEGYRKITEAFGGSAEKKEEFKKKKISNEFYGSCYSRSGLLRTQRDELFIFDRENCNNFMINYDTQEIFDSLYLLENTDKKDKYSVFLGGNYGHIGIYGKDSASKETLIIIKDSFANCTVPFFAKDYNIEVYDLRYYNGSISEAIIDVDPDKILILYGIDTVITDGSLRLLDR